MLHRIRRICRYPVMLFRMRDIHRKVQRVQVRVRVKARVQAQVQAQVRVLQA